MRFRVVAASHTRREGKKSVTYKQGDVIESDTDLRKLYANKFEKLSNKEPAEVKAKNKRKEKEAEEEGDVAEQGEVNEEDRDGVYDNKSTVSAAGVTSKLGDNVTEDYAKAKEGNLLVFKKGSSFQVAEPEDPETAINKKPLKASELKKFIKEYLSK